jgi:ribonuclease R
VTGGLMLELLQLEGADMPGGASARRGRPTGRKAGAAKAKAGNVRRTVERKRRG